MSKQSAEALVLLQNLIDINYEVSIKNIMHNETYELTIFRSIHTDEHSHYQGDTFIDVIIAAAKAEGIYYDNE